MRSKCLKRGVALVDDIVIIAIVALVLTGGVSVAKFTNLFHSNDTKQKQTTTLVASDITDAQAAAKKAAEAQAALDAANKAKQQAIHESVRVAKTALESEKAPTMAEGIALTFVDKADAGFDDPLSTTDANEASTIFLQLSAQNAADRAAGQAKADALQLKLDSANKSVRDSQTANDQTKGLLDKALLKAQDDDKSLVKWAADNQTLAQRIKQFILWASIFGVLYFLVFWLLPAVGKEFPAFAPLAKAVAAVGAWPMHVLREAELEVVKLAHEATQAKLAVTTAALSSEQAAHAATTATLVKVATTP